MAVSMNVVEKTLKDLELEITCAICQNYYTDPKILPCLHYYCEACVGYLALKAGGKPFPCPECGMPTVLSPGGEKELKSVFAINCLRSVYDKHKKALKRQLICEICTNSEAYADYFCQQCDKFACKGCVHLHSVMKTSFEGHECMPVEKLYKIKIKAKELPISKDHTKPKAACSLHEEPLDIFCFDCNKLICRDCAVKDHRGDELQFSNVAADNKRKEIKKPLIDRRDFLSQSLAEMDKTKNEILQRQKSAADEVKSSFEELHKILEIHQTRLLKDIAKMAEEKLEEVSAQTQALSHWNNNVQDVVNSTEQCMETFSDEEVISKHRSITESIQANDKQETLANVDSITDFIVGADCSKALDQICKDMFVTSPTALEVNLKDIPKTVDLLKPFKFEVSFKTGVLIVAPSLKCQLRCIGGAITAARITERGRNKYQVTCTPTEYGQQELEITVYDHPLPGTPVTVKVVDRLWEFAGW